MLSVEMPNENSEESTPTRPPSSAMVDFVEKTGPSGERIFESNANKNFKFNEILPESAAKQAAAPVAEKTFYFNADNPSPVIKENKDLGLSQADILAGIKARDKDFENVKIEAMHPNRLKDSYDESSLIADAGTDTDTEKSDGELGVDNHLAPRSGSELSLGTRDNNPTEEVYMQPQQVTPELNSLTPEPVVSEITGAEAMSDLVAPTLEINQTNPAPELTSEAKLVSDLVSGGEAIKPAISSSEVLAQAPFAEAQPLGAPNGELPIADLITETVIPTPEIEEVRSEFVNPEVPAEAPLPSIELATPVASVPEPDVIDFNQIKESAVKANEGFVTDIKETQKNFERKLTDAGVPETGSANFREMQKESDKLRVELGAQIDDTQEKFENLQNRLETQRQEILKNAQEVMTAASADIKRAQERHDRKEVAIMIKEEEIARERNENEEQFSRIVEKNNPILERAHELINEYGSSSSQGLSNQSLEKTA